MGMVAWGLFSLWYSLDDQVAFDEDSDEGRDATLRVLNEFESIAPRKL